MMCIFKTENILNSARGASYACPIAVHFPKPPECAARIWLRAACAPPLFFRRSVNDSTWANFGPLFLRWSVKDSMWANSLNVQRVMRTSTIVGTSKTCHRNAQFAHRQNPALGARALFRRGSLVRISGNPPPPTPPPGAGG